jgi:TRAP-type C4-dicarboxylate transport system substrate-binding protein
MNIKRVSLFLALVLSLSLILSSAACAGDWEGITLKISHNLSSTDILQTYLQQAADKIYERTEGKVRFDIYPNGELLTYAEAVEAIASDSHVVYYCAFSDWKDYYPGAGAYSAAYVFDSVEQYQKFMETDFFANTLAELDKQNIHCLQAGWIGGFRHTLTNIPVNTMADLKGLSIRTPANPVWVDCFESLGMSVVGMAWSETLTAVSQGSIDSVEGTYSTVVSYNCWDYFKYLTETKHIIQAECLWMSANVWNSIPAAYQAIISEEMKPAAQGYVQASADLESQMRQQAIDNGMEVNREIDLSEFKAAAGKYVLQYDIGQEMLDVLAGL